MKKWIEKTLDIFGMTVGGIGGVAWGIYGITGFIGKQFNIVDKIFGIDTILANFIYTLVGVGTVWLIWKGLKKLF